MFKPDDPGPPAPGDKELARQIICSLNGILGGKVPVTSVPGRDGHQADINLPFPIFDILEKGRDYNGEYKRITAPEDWNRIYRNSPYYHKYIETRLNEICNKDAGANVEEEVMSHSRPATLFEDIKNKEVLFKECIPKSHLKQIINLVHRRLLVFFRDTLSTAESALDDAVCASPCLQFVGYARA